MTSPFSWSFTTGPAPAVTGESPAPAATGVAVSSPVTATFNEAVQSSTIGFTLTSSTGSVVAGTVAYNSTNNTVTLTPSAALAYATTYTAAVSGAKDTAGDPMTSPFSWSFTTTASTVTTGTTYYVATTGKDSNAGTLASPFATMQHAMMSLKPGDTLDVEPGTYAGFIVGWDSTPASSGDPYGYVDGTASAPITIQAAPGSAAGSVVINSADNKTQAGIDLEPGDNYITISGFAINGSTGGIAASPNKGEGIKIAGSTNVTVKNTTVTGIGYGFGIIADNANNVVLEDNTITGTGDGGNSDYGHGIYISGSTNDAVVVGNTIANNAYIGIHINGDASEGGIGLVTNALVENNVIYNNGQNGINADGLQSSVIENNLIYNYQNYGICLYQSDAAAGSKNNVIVDNTIDSGTSTGTGGAIRILDSSTGNTILNNILLDGSTNVYRIAADSVSGTVSNYNVVSVGAQVQSDDTGSEEPFSSWQSSTGQDKNSFSATPANFSSVPRPTTSRNYPPVRRSAREHQLMRRVPTSWVIPAPVPAAGISAPYEYEGAMSIAPTVTSATPGANATGVATNTTVTATFNVAVLASTITTTNFVLKSSSGSTVTAAVSYNSTTYVATLTPSASWPTRRPTPPPSVASRATRVSP